MIVSESERLSPSKRYRAGTRRDLLGVSEWRNAKIQYFQSPPRSSVMSLSPSELWSSSELKWDQSVFNAKVQKRNWRKGAVRALRDAFLYFRQLSDGEEEVRKVHGPLGGHTSSTLLQQRCETPDGPMMDAGYGFPHAVLPSTKATLCLTACAGEIALYGVDCGREHGADHVQDGCNSGLHVAIQTFSVLLRFGTHEGHLGGFWSRRVDHITEISQAKSIEVYVCLRTVRHIFAGGLKRTPDLRLSSGSMCGQLNWTTVAHILCHSHFPVPASISSSYWSSLSPSNAETLIAGRPRQCGGTPAV